MSSPGGAVRPNGVSHGGSTLPRHVLPTAASTCFGLTPLRGARPQWAGLASGAARSSGQPRPRQGTKAASLLGPRVCACSHSV